MTVYSLLIINFIYKLEYISNRSLTLTMCTWVQSSQPIGNAWFVVTSSNTKLLLLMDSLCSLRLLKTSVVWGGRSHWVQVSSACTVWGVGGLRLGFIIQSSCSFRLILASKQGRYCSEPEIHTTESMCQSAPLTTPSLPRKTIYWETLAKPVAPLMLTVGQHFN